ncbi:MAG: DUF1553 domain-containing protein [Bacteroidales bacterium]|nr:DUF1553 domain-containing protein [Bacteroidales bacterium]
MKNCHTLPFRLGMSWALTLGLAGILTTTAAPPRDAAEKTALIGQPRSIVVAPATVTLNGPHGVAQLVVTGHYPGGQIRDLSTVAHVQLSKPIASIGAGLFLRGVQDGQAELTVTAGAASVRVPVVVAGASAATPVSFRHDVIAALNVGGCNAGACHGTPTGKNGFRLSLRGFDPAWDFQQLTREQFGRRTDKHHPAASLLMLKGLGQIPHEGGARFAASSYPAEMLRVWQAEGLRDDPTNLPIVKKLDVLPGTRIQLNPARWQQVAVIATYSDGSQRDVTRLSNFSSSDTGIAEVDMNGLVEFKRAGEVAILVRYLEELRPVRFTYLEPRENFAWPNIPEQNFVDKHVFAKLKQMTILPSELASDAEFVRRSYLDAIGRLPTPQEAKDFLADRSPNKRDRLIDQLVLQPEFADFWTLKWSDVLRSSRKTMQQKGTFAFHAWLRDRIAANAGIDKIVTELLTSEGNTYANPAANYYRVAKSPEDLAESTAQLFLGIRMQCAKCHNHISERWTQDDYYGFAAWFARVKTKPEPTLGTPAKKKGDTAEIVVNLRSGEVKQPRTGQVMQPRKLGEGDAVIAPNQDRREVLAQWLTNPANPYFSKSVANRVWFHLMGKGIVDPVDDFRDSNPASNDDLLNALAADFSGHGYDLRHLVRTIMKSRTYQLAAQPNETNRDDEKYFSHAITKLLTAEQLLDAICDVTAVPENYGLPAGTRAVQLPDGAGGHPFLKTFGQPARELACECERESDGNLAQALQLINGPTVNGKVRSTSNRITQLLAATLTDEARLTELYFAALSRPPETPEVSAALAHISQATDKRKAWEDVLWAVMNTREFLFRH